MAKKLLLFAFAAFLLISPSGTAIAKGHERSSGNLNMATQALEQLRQAYVERNAQEFFKWVSDTPYFNWQDLKFQIVRHFSDFGQIDLVWVVNESLTEGNKVLLKTHWRKRWVNNATGVVELAEGDTQFVFVTKKNAKLIDIKGNSPF